MECRTVKWVKLPAELCLEQDLYGRIDEDGLMRVTCTANHAEYLAWVAEGNTAEEWNPEENI